MYHNMPLPGEAWNYIIFLWFLMPNSDRGQNSLWDDQLTPISTSTESLNIHTQRPYCNMSSAKVIRWVQQGINPPGSKFNSEEQVAAMWPYSILCDPNLPLPLSLSPSLLSLSIVIRLWKFSVYTWFFFYAGISDYNVADTGKLCPLWIMLGGEHCSIHTWHKTT